jgi:hypothetical protein
MGEYSEASIKLKGPFTEAAFRSSYSRPEPSMSDLVEKRDGRYPPSPISVCGYNADYNFLDLQNQDSESQQYAFVFVAFVGDVCFGLALRQISDTEYERIGLCLCYTPSRESRELVIRSYLSSLPFREVKII